MVVNGIDNMRIHTWYQGCWFVCLASI